MLYRRELVDLSKDPEDAIVLKKVAVKSNLLFDPEDPVGSECLVELIKDDIKKFEEKNQKKEA